MSDLNLLPYISKYRTKSGALDLEKLLNDPTVIVTQHLHENTKKLEVITLSNGLVYYAKPIGDFRGASAEKILSKLYQLSGFISPETTIAEYNNKIYAVTNDVLPSHNTERGYIFLRGLCPGGEQYVLPDIYKYGSNSNYYKAFTRPSLEQIAKYYGFAVATRNWDANLCNLNFRFTGKTHDVAQGVVSIDYEKSHDPGYGYYEIRYVNPFEPRRVGLFELYRQFVEASKATDLVNLKKIANDIEISHAQIDEVVRESKDDGFVPDKQYIEDLKVSMYATVENFEREI